MAHEREVMLRRKQTGSTSLIFSSLSDLAFSQQIPTSVISASGTWMGVYLVLLQASSEEEEEEEEEAVEEEKEIMSLSLVK
ncbi:hypothetical protein NC651_033455 [Populus alba x Populus x berolinensis]|nr:hypothetical protein NC651_033455 [Populus alba x Populus x berolinensis]